MRANALSTLSMWLTVVVALAQFALAVESASAQLTLSGSSYSQDFNSIGSGLPTGWTGRTPATVSSLGTTATFTTAPTIWSTNTGQFANYASNNIALGSSTATQNADANRAFGVRQVAATDPGAAFTLQLTNTSGFTNFDMEFDLMTLDDSAGRATTYTIRYGLGSSPTTFTTLGTYTSGSFTDTHETFGSAVLSGIANQNQNVWIQIAALTATVGSGARDTVALDDFSLTFSPAAVPEPSTWFTALLALGLLTFTQRRRLARLVSS